MMSSPQRRLSEDLRKDLNTSSGPKTHSWNATTEHGGKVELKGKLLSPNELRKLADALEQMNIDQVRAAIEYPRPKPR